jgi:hypothetical protein
MSEFTPESSMSQFSMDEKEEISLCEALDRILKKGAVVKGEVTISIADIDLVYLGLELVLSSVETARKARGPDTMERLCLSTGASGRTRVGPIAREREGTS